MADTDVTFAPVATASRDGVRKEVSALERGRTSDPEIRTPMRLGVYTDMAYRSDDEGVYANRAFIRFITELPPRVAELTILGRLDPERGRGPYRLPGGAVRFTPLPHYPKISSIRRMVAASRGSWRAFDAELTRLDAVWIFGPHPMAVLFALLARRRRMPLILGVRQDYPRYIAHRLPGQRWRWAPLAARGLDAIFRQLARQAPTVALGEDLARRYAVGAPVLTTGFSLVPNRELTPLAQATARSWTGVRRVLSVGRLDSEKNPALLLEVIARLRALDPRWRLDIAGDGPLRPQLEAEIRRRGLTNAVELWGEVANGPQLWALYRRCHVFLHVSLTEGLPQVLFEAMAAGLPIVATAVGGVPSAVRDAGLLIAPQDPGAAVGALDRLARDPWLRRRLITLGLDRVATQTMEAQLDRIATFISESVR